MCRGGGECVEDVSGVSTVRVSGLSVSGLSVSGLSVGGFGVDSDTLHWTETG